MNVLLVQFDGKQPNIALMRIATHYRRLHHDVCFSYRQAPRLFFVPDFVYISTIFDWNRTAVEAFVHQLPQRSIVHVGGTGWSIPLKLEDIGIQTKVQDYSIYPGFRQSIGFTQRGCRLSCTFCVVSQKEGRVTEEMSIFDIWRGEPYPRELLLLDNDFFGQLHWRDRIHEIRDHGFKVSFNQGINCRFIDEEAAEAIASVDYRDDSMRYKRIYTAWDNRKDEARLFRGLQLLVDAGVARSHIMVYMLIGYCHAHQQAASLCQCSEADSHENRDYRRRELRDFGALPYPMPYRTGQDPEHLRMLIGFQRWIITHADKELSWDQWTRSGYQIRTQPQPGGLVFD